jgi:hypothetical protein
MAADPSNIPGQDREKIGFELNHETAVEMVQSEEKIW